MPLYPINSPLTEPTIYIGTLSSLRCDSESPLEIHKLIVASDLPRFLISIYFLNTIHYHPLPQNVTGEGRRPPFAERLCPTKIPDAFDTFSTFYMYLYKNL